MSEREKGKINLQLVADVLKKEGLDPTVEIAKILQKPGALDAKTRAMICLELIQYQQPKLKAIESTHKFETTPEQDKTRLRALLTKAGIPIGTVGAEKPEPHRAQGAGGTLGEGGAPEEAPVA